MFSDTNSMGGAAAVIFAWLCLLGAFQAEASGPKPRSFIIKEGTKIICSRIEKDLCYDCDNHPHSIVGYKPVPTNEPCPMYENSEGKVPEQKSKPEAAEKPKPQKGKKQAAGSLYTPE